MAEAFADRAAAAIDDAALEQLRNDFISLIAKVAGGEALPSALEKFETGAGQVKAAHAAARVSVAKIFT